MTQTILAAFASGIIVGAVIAWLATWLIIRGKLRIAHILLEEAQAHIPQHGPDGKFIKHV